MKRLFFILFTALAVVAASADAFGQARINTKKHKIADITTHTTKIVLGGNEMTDAALKSEVTARWRVSPYEFCDADEYRRIKEDPDYYFLIIARSDERKYDGILTLTLIKGGKPGGRRDGGPCHGDGRGVPSCFFLVFHSFSPYVLFFGGSRSGDANEGRLARHLRRRYQYFHFVSPLFLRRGGIADDH